MRVLRFAELPRSKDRLGNGDREGKKKEKKRKKIVEEPALQCSLFSGFRCCKVIEERPNALSRLMTALRR